MGPKPTIKTLQVPSQNKLVRERHTPNIPRPITSNSSVLTPNQYWLLIQIKLGY